MNAPAGKADDEANRQVLEQEVARLRTMLRDAHADTRTKAWTQARRQFKGFVAVLGLTTLMVGGLIGHYGFRGKPSRLEATQGPDSPSWLSPVSSDSSADKGDETATAPWPISVYVSGAVTKAQVVELPAGSLVADAVDRAGGASADADLDAVNLAAPLTDNQHVVIPRLTDRVDSITTEPPTALSTPAARVDINTASSDELETLPYIGEKKAADIVAYRTANGPFKRIEDIENVPGIGSATYEHIAHLITIEH